MDFSEDLDEADVSCVTTDMPAELVLKRVSLVDFSVSEIPLQVGGISAVAPFFAYLHNAFCPTLGGATIGTLIPGVPSGSTKFFATFIDAPGVVQGTDQVVLPGARDDHQAFFVFRTTT